MRTRANDSTERRHLDARTIYVDGEDTEADAIGVKGLGEAVIVGVAPGGPIGRAAWRQVR
jgi:xanthine dehydrogenase YagR molybdenum-binding subunit